jgi:acetyl-CoA decarbonylase/synthase complex subunit delta
MPFEIPRTAYSGKIKETTLGKGERALTIGGETAFPFHLYEGRMPNLPRIAMEVCDIPPADWPETLLEPFGGAIKDPVTWAKKCVNDYGAEAIYLQLASTDPNGQNRPADEAVKTVKKVADAVNVPLIVWGVANAAKDAEVLTKVAETCRGRNIMLGPVEQGNHKQIGTAAITCGHTIAAATPIDTNLAKQLNIFLGNLGVPDNALVMDPTVSSIGYGIEYCYSVMERMRIAALTQADAKLQYPILCNLGKETWKTKEARMTEKENPAMGDAKKRGILLEAMTAVILLMAGSDLLIMRHPAAVKLVKEMIAGLTAA